MTTGMMQHDELLDEYKKIHNGEASFLVNGKKMASSKVFDGSNFNSELGDLFDHYMRSPTTKKAITLLDYGCGKAAQLHTPGWRGTKMTFHQAYPGRIAAYWCYDPGYETFDTRPPNIRFDAVVCADVLEHVPEEHAASVVSELFDHCAMKDGVVFMSISGRPAVKHFAKNGENMHRNQKPLEWWLHLINSKATCKYGLVHHGLETKTVYRNF